MEIPKTGVMQEESGNECKQKRTKSLVIGACGPWAYLLREATKELIEELREDEADVLERFKERDE